MVVKHSGRIELKPKTITIIIVLGLLLFISLILIEDYKISRLVFVEHKTAIDSILVKGEFGILRGGIAYKERHIINTTGILIENNYGYNKWKSHGPIIDFDTIPYINRLSDLATPYTLFKKANSDTLFVEKDGYPLKFLLGR